MAQNVTQTELTLPRVAGVFQSKEDLMEAASERSPLLRVLRAQKALLSLNLLQELRSSEIQLGLRRIETAIVRHIAEIVITELAARNLKDERLIRLEEAMKFSSGDMSESRGRAVVMGSQQGVH